MDITPRYAAAILPTMVLVGLGFALAFSALNIQATSGIADEEQGLASGLLQTSGQLGGALALASVTAVVTSGGSHHAASAAQTLAAYRPGLVLVSIVGGLGLDRGAIRSAPPLGGRRRGGAGGHRRGADAGLRRLARTPIRSGARRPRGQER